MAEKLGEALLDLDTDDRKFNAGVDRAQRKATGLGRTFDETGRRAAQLGKVMASAAAIGAAAFTAGIIGAVKRLEDMRKMSAQVDQALKNSGNSARTSAKELEAWAEKLQDKTGRAAEEIMAVGANLASFGFGRETFFRAIQLADDMSAAWGGDLRQNLEGLSRALDDPINGMAMLSKRGVKLTADQKELAKSLLDAGDKASAQGVVFEALEGQVKGVAEAGFTGLTAAIARGREAWENAFEDLVQGKGDTADLRDTLVELADSLSSPDFIQSVMGFGSIIVGMINMIAHGIVATWDQLERFLNWLNSQQDQAEKPDAIAAQIAQEKAKLEELKQFREKNNDAFAKAQHDTSVGGFFNGLGAMASNTLSGVDKGIELRQQAIDALEAKLAKLSDPSKFDVNASFGKLKGAGTYDDPAAMWRALSPGTMFGQDDTDPYAGLNTQTDEARKAAEKQHDALVKLIADLEHERDVVGLSARDQEIMNTVRRAGVDAMSDEGLHIREIMTVTDEHRDQLQQTEDAYKALGDAGKTALKGLVDAMQDGKIEGNELLGILGNVLSVAGQYFLNQGASGGGQLGSLLGNVFSGLFADGGLIPNGTFGIVGEEGPEPVFATSSGAQVSSHSSLADLMGSGGGTVNNVTINGSGLSEAELSRAIGNALDRFDRFTLPGRVAAINADPLARG